MIFKRNYTIKPVPVGHPKHINNWHIHEVVVKEGNKHALFYVHFRPNQDITIFINSLENLTWEQLDAFTDFDRGI